MGRQSKLPRNSSRGEPLSLCSVLFLGCFCISIILLVVSASYVVSFPSLSSWLSSHHASPPAPLQREVTEEKISPPEHDMTSQNEKRQKKSFCDTSSKRADICEVEGDIRILGNSSSIFFVSTSDNWNTTALKGSWHINPHPRKGMPSVTKVLVKSLSTHEDAPKCMNKNKVPAIVFSIGGFMGNFFHDFSDVLVPLYLTAHQFNGEVQFLIGDMIPWWITKYEEIFKQLSHYEIIDLNKDHIVRCYSEVIVGLKFHNDMSIDPSRSGGVTMVDFGWFLRRAYGLKRDTAIKLGMSKQKKPRLLIISRKWTRRFDNLDEITRFAEWMGFEVVAADKQANLTIGQFAEIVNSCDVMMGVHGAGLTNLVFLPTHAVVIQVVPLGGLESICWSDFGVPTLDMKLHYLQYSICVAESTLTEKYPATNPDFPVLTDPKAILNRGDDARNWTNIYFFEQSVKLDVNRFSSVLLQTLELLR